MLSDHELGQGLGRAMDDQAAAGLTPAEGSRRLLAQLQDLLGADTSLASPLRDLLLRPAFRELFSGTGPARMQRQQHLLHDLGHTYSAAVVERLQLVLHGCLDLPAAPTAAAPGRLAPLATAIPGGQASGVPSSLQGPSSPTGSPPFNAQHTLSPNNSNHLAHVGPSDAGHPQGQPSAGLIAVIGLLAMISGGLVAALGWVLHLQRQPLTANTSAAPPSALQRDAGTTATPEASNPISAEPPAEPTVRDQRWQACVAEDGRQGPPPQSGETWWPVVGPADALEAARRHCRSDAFLNSQGNVQIASFRDHGSAEAFAETLTTDSSHPWGFRVGEASVRP